jgi:hypothetical protein
MIKDSLNKKEVRNEARQIIKKGTSKQETLKILVEKYKFEKDIAEVLQNLISQRAIEKYGKWNWLLLVLLVVPTIYFAVFGAGIGTFFWFGLMIYVVAGKLTKYYGFVSAMYAFGLLGSIGIMATSDAETTSWPRTFITYTIGIGTMVLAYWLGRKLSPSPIERKEPYTNSEGQRRLKVVYEFED